MDFSSPILQTLLQRTNLILPIADFLKEVESTYSIGRITEFFPISEGYEDANIKIKAEKGEFVLKIFTIEKTFTQVQDYVHILSEAKKREIPVVGLIEGNQGPLSIYKSFQNSTYYILTKFFEGENFEKQTPTEEDIQEVTNILARFNEMNIQIEELYDSWSNKNLVREFSQNSNGISEATKELLTPIVEKMRLLDTSSLSKSTIHGDLQRKHVLKSKNNTYCLLDLGCIRYDAKVFDLSTHLAWFCLAEDTWAKKEKIVEQVLNTYTKLHQLSKEELASLPLLVRSAYAAYLRKTAFLIANGDNTHETKDWFEKSNIMLQLMSEWDWKILN